MATRASNEQNATDLEQHHHGLVGENSVDSEKTYEAVKPDHLQNGSKPVDVPPDGGYGWVCTACAFLINAHTWGVNSVRFCSYPLSSSLLNLDLR
jgi:hypothetical protein